MERLEKKVDRASLEESWEDAILYNNIISLERKYGNSVIFSKDRKVLIIKTKEGERRIGHTPKGEFYFSSYQEHNVLGKPHLIDYFKDEEYTVKKEGKNKVIIKSKNKELRINHDMNKVICSLSATKDIIMKEYTKLLVEYGSIDADLS